MNKRLIPKLAYLNFICLTIVLVGCDPPDTKEQAEAYQNEILQEAIAAKAMAEASLARAEAEAARIEAELAEMKADRLESEITNSPNTQAEDSDNNQEEDEFFIQLEKFAAFDLEAGKIVDKRFGDLFQSQKETEAISLLQEYADKGSSQAAFMLGRLYDEGKFLPENTVKARELYRIAAAANNIFAIKALWECYFHGYGVERDRREAFRWASIGAPLGTSPLHTWLQFRLAFDWEDAPKANSIESYAWYTVLMVTDAEDYEKHRRYRDTHVEKTQMTLEQQSRGQARAEEIFKEIQANEARQ